MDTSDKVRENRLRRVAVRRGLSLQKTRRRDPRARDFGTYYLVNDNGQLLGYEMSLDAVEEYLA